MSPPRRLFKPNTRAKYAGLRTLAEMRQAAFAAQMRERNAEMDREAKERAERDE